MCVVVSGNGGKVRVWGVVECHGLCECFVCQVYVEVTNCLIHLVQTSKCNIREHLQKHAYDDYDLLQYLLCVQNSTTSSKFYILLFCGQCSKITKMSEANNSQL